MNDKNKDKKFSQSHSTGS